MFCFSINGWGCRCNVTWLNLNIKRNGKFFIIEKYCYNGVFFINDIVSEDKQFLSYQEFQNKYKIITNFLDYYGIVDAVPERWKKNWFQSMGGFMILIPVSPTVQYSDSPIVRQSNSPTVQYSDSPIVRQSNTPTVQ
jgi:hypothetical protein